MTTILRVRDEKPEPKPEVVLDCSLKETGDGEISWRIQEQPIGIEFSVARFSLRRGIRRVGCLPTDLGLPLDARRRLVDYTPDTKGDVNQELLSACEVGRDLLRHHHDGKEGEVYMQLKKAIASAKRLMGERPDEAT